MDQRYGSSGRPLSSKPSLTKKKKNSLQEKKIRHQYIHEYIYEISKKKSESTMLKKRYYNQMKFYCGNARLI
jgi:hypothetical protein